jgi:NADH-quinone oxidoreductase subunit F
MAKLYARLQGGRGSPEDVLLLDNLVREIDGKCFCPLGEFALSAPRSTLKLFRDDYERAAGALSAVSASQAPAG